jgi:hypothetical protein
MKSTDYQVAGSHYQKLKIQPIDYILANELGFCEGAISRWRDKGGVDDLRKIKQFCEFLIEEELKNKPLPTMEERRLPRG